MTTKLAPNSLAPTDLSYVTITSALPLVQAMEPHEESIFMMIWRQFYCKEGRRTCRFYAVRQTEDTFFEINAYHVPRLMVTR